MNFIKAFNFLQNHKFSSFVRGTLRGIFSLVIIFFIFSIFTCQPGLGGKVDTRAPEVKIISPASKSILSGSFTMSGTVNDDLAVSKVEVLFTNRSTGSVSGPHLASVSGEKWSLYVTSGNTSSTLITDGDYTAQVIAYDGSNHTSTNEVVYTIDTTPPTVLITSPTKYSVPSSQTANVVIKGEVYDASTVESVEVYIVDASGAKKANIQADGTNSFLATFENLDLEEYSETKDTVSNKVIGSPIYYYYAVASDAGGNSSKYFYHKEDVWDLLGSHNDTNFPSINEIGKLDQMGGGYLWSRFSRFT